jgi:aspartate-semialdehyde dehydrogenase
LSAIEQRIERDLATVLANQQGIGPLPMPSLRVVAAPVFHGYSLSIWVEFETNVNSQELGEALASAQIEVRDANQEAPDNVGVAGQSGLVAGDIRVDRNNSRAAWLWIVADNLRLTADAAAELIAKLEAPSQ